MNEIVLASSVKPAKWMLFLFHGYGKTKENFNSIGRELLRARPDIEIHIPDGVAQCDEGPGREWFEFNGENVSIWEEDYLKTSGEITKYIDEVLESRQMTYENTIFAGFSQGAMVSLGLGLKLGIAGVIAFSGLLLDAKSCIGKTHTKVLLLHGAADEVIPVEAMKLTERVLTNAGVPVKSEIYPTLKHEIDRKVLAKAVDFLKSL